MNEPTLLLSVAIAATECDTYEYEYINHTTLPEAYSGNLIEF